MALSAEQRALRARIGGLAKARAADDPELEAARSRLIEARADAYIQQLVAQAKPLSPTHRARLAALLMPSSRGATV